MSKQAEMRGGDTQIIKLNIDVAFSCANVRATMKVIARHTFFFCEELQDIRTRGESILAAAQRYEYSNLSLVVETLALRNGV